MTGMVMVTKAGGCGGGAGAGGRGTRESEEQNQISIVALLLAALRKSMVACRVDQGEDVISVVHQMEIGWPTNVQHLTRFHGFLGLPVEFEVEIPCRVPSASFFFPFSFYFVNLHFYFDGCSWISTRIASRHLLRSLHNTWIHLLHSNQGLDGGLNGTSSPCEINWNDTLRSLIRCMVKQRYSSLEAEKFKIIKSINLVPPYLKREGFRPSKPQDFGDGGAFPEIHYAQYPLDMGRKQDANPKQKTLPVTVDEHGRLTFDAIVKQNINASKIVYSQHRDLVPKILKDEMDDEEEMDDIHKEIEETAERTKAALEKIVNVRLSAAQPKKVQTQSSDSNFIKYKPSQKSAAFNSGAKERVIRMVEMNVDPLEPPKFKHKCVPRASGSPPVPIMHSPVRSITVKDQQDWKIPPRISIWKNPKGYAIPLDKRLVADGRGLQEVQINDNFVKLTEALYVAESKAKLAVDMRSKVQRELMKQEKDRKEQELRALAQKARSEMTGAASPAAAPEPTGKSTAGEKEEKELWVQREKIREERRRDRKRERRIEAKDAAMGKKSKVTRDRDRDIGEKVALGMASAGSGKGGEVMYDQRLFNQEKGMDSGFAADDQNNVYTKGLFTAQSTLSTLYRPKKDLDNDTYGGADEQMDRIMKTERFKPDRAFAGTNEKTGPRDRPVEFEKDAEDADPFGLDRFLTQVRTGKKAIDKVGSGGTMKASAGSSMRDGSEGSGRTRIGFEKGS